ncbi:MAG: hypothetical protein OEM62_06720 [Acidobacteriota bacterium]|nr:hypothetical protein [Acidobacteriota bacterium]
MQRTTPILLLVAPLLFSSVTGAQEAADTTAMVEEANRKLDEWIDNTNDFVGDVRIDAGDIESFIEHYAEFSELGDEMDDDEEFVDYDEVLADPRYRSFAAGHGLVAEPWLKKSMRIIALSMRGQMQAGLAQAEAQMPEQRRMIDEQCAQMGPEMCTQMKASIEMSMAMFEHQKNRLGDLPEATASEQALLERYAEEMASLMESGEEEWDEDEDEEEW